MKKLTPSAPRLTGNALRAALRRCGVTPPRLRLA
jgi:hypothetical protein